MPRRREVAKRVILPDPKYGDRTVAKLVNIMMQDGKKSTAERALYQALDLVAQRTGEDAVKVLKKSLDNIKPMLEVKSRRVGGSTYQVPVEVRAF
jgi:small subunit ribosomal protein S7